MKIIGGTTAEQAAICERCGAPILHQVWVEDDDGEIHIYGSTCALRMVGNAEVERATREAMERRDRARQTRDEHIAHKLALAPIAAQLKEMRRQAAELNRTDPIAALHLSWEIVQLEQRHTA